MSTAVLILAGLTPVVCLALAVFAGLRSMKRTGNAKRAFGRHFLTLAVSVSLCFLFAVIASAATGDAGDAAQAAESAASAVTGSAAGMGFIGAALSVGLSGIGAGIALAAGAPAAIGAVSEDPKSFGKSMIFVVLGEAIALYGFVVAMLIVLMKL